MILANVFCLLFFLGEYLRAASRGGGARCRALGSRRKAGNATGERGGHRGRLAGRARRGEPGLGSGEPSGLGGVDAGGETRAAAGWLRGGGGID